MAMPDALSSTTEGSGARARIQRFGGYLSGMVMPNIGAFIAFGFITALFIPDGWTPNADLAEMVGPMIIVLIPTLVAYSGGRMVHGQRGAVIGAVAVFGAIVAGADPVRLNDGTTALPFGGQVMILGAFVLGPLSAYLLKLFDNLVAGRVKAGFEMLIDNFSIGILGGVMAIFGYTVIEPIVGWITDRLGDGVETLVNHSLLPLSSVIIEPAKVLFLNNAINHGVLTPLPASDRSGRTDHPVLRRDPRDLLPLRADAAEDDPRHHRGRGLGHRGLPGVRRRPDRPGGTGQLHRLHGRDGQRRLRRSDP